VASTAALANGVTVYGRLDTSMAKQTNQPTQLNHSNWDTSVIGVKGSEDLGNGLTASFQLEGGLNSTTGETHNNGSLAAVFNRLANIKLSSESMGTVGAGMQLSPFIAAALTGTATNNESFYVPMLVMGNAAGATTYVQDSRNGVTAGTTTAAGTRGFFIPSSVSYTSPNIGGVTVSVLSQLGGANTSVQDANQKYRAMSISYSAGDLSAAFGYEDNPTQAAKTTSLAAAYMFGSLRVAGGYITSNPTAAGSDLNTLHGGFSYPLAESLSASLNYAKNDATTKQEVTTAGLLYNISKRTYAYGILSRGTAGALALYGSGNRAGTITAGAGNGTSTGYAVGIGHNF
jgi:predicted porin